VNDVRKLDRLFGTRFVPAAEALECVGDAGTGCGEDSGALAGQRRRA
jgi:hypothetical protein